MTERRSAIQARAMTPALERFARDESDSLSATDSSAQSSATTLPPTGKVGINSLPEAPSESQPPPDARDSVSRVDTVSSDSARPVRIHRKPKRKLTQHSRVAPTRNTELPTSNNPQAPPPATRTSVPVEWKQYSGRLTAHTLRRFKTFCLRRELADIYPHRQQELLEEAVVNLLAKYQVLPD